jgi:hypothetical protein
VVVRPKKKRGGQKGNTNRLRHGRYTSRLKAARRRVRDVIRQTRSLVAQIEARHERAEK